MQILEIKVQIDLGNLAQMQATQQFIAALNGTGTPTFIGTQETAVTAPPEEKQEEKPKKRKRRTKAEIAADKAAAEAATKQEEADNAEPEEQSKKETTEGEYDVSQVRTLLSEKVKTHRAEIKEKLSELGAKNVSSIKEGDYPAFMDFLNGLG